MRHKIEINNERRLIKEAISTNLRFDYISYVGTNACLVGDIKQFLFNTAFSLMIRTDTIVARR